MAPQGAGMMPSQGQGPDLQSIISTYAQAKGMSGEEANQLYNQIMQMPQDQQQQVIAQLTQELSSTQVPVARYGGDMGSKKRLMKKAIGGVSPNTTMENVVDNRRETVMNAIGANMSRNLVDETYNEAQQAAQAFNPYSQPQMQFGGRSPFYGGMDPNNNPFMDDAYETQSDFKDAMGKLGNSLWNIGATMKPKDIKVKAKGDIFNRTKTQDKNAFFNQDVDENVIPDYLQFDTASAYNPSLGNYQPGGETGGDALTNTLTDLNINTDSYNTAKQAVDNGSYTGDQLEIVNRVNRAQQQLYPNQVTNTTTNNTTNASTPSGAINGWHGPYLFKDGKVIDMVDQKQGQQQVGYSPSSFTNQRLDPFAYLNSPQGMQAFGTAMKGFQPDDVHLSKLKGKSGLFGNKFVAEWDYNQDGKGLANGPNEVPERRFNFGFNQEDDNYGRFDQAVDAFKAKRNDRRGERNYEKRYGQPTDQQSDYTTTVNNMTGFGGSGMGAMERFDDNRQPVKVQPGIPQSATNYPQPSPYDPTLDYVPEQFAGGGKAGRLVAKQGNGLFGDVNNMAAASGIIAGMNALSAAKNRTDIDENMTLADSINPVMMDSVDRNPLQQGLWGTGPLTGEEVPNLQPFNQGYRWSQGQGNGIMDQNQFSRYGGNTYQEGGVYELDEDEINEIMRNGGSIQYFD
jgi:hypothetical protein